MKTYLLAAALITAGFALPAQAQTAQPGATAHWQPQRLADGRPDLNWFNATNWSTGRVPGPDDYVVLDGDDDVVITGFLARIGELKVRGIAMHQNAYLEVVDGAIVNSTETVLSGNATLVYRASGETGEALVAAPYTPTGGCGDCLIVQNPNPKTQRAVILQSSVTTDMGLGGTAPASLTTEPTTGTRVLQAGRGHYSTMTADTLVLDGRLTMSLYYGFRPVAGDRFNLFSGRTVVGQFHGLPEGGLAGCTDENVGLYISYRGGDGNDVVLSAKNTPPVTCLLLPAVQKVRDAAARAQATRHRSYAIVDRSGATTQAREHVLLARQVGY